jgi:hypothetical protein
MDTTAVIFDNVSFTDVLNVAKFIYTGKVTLNENDLSSFIDLGNMLKVRGIIGIGIDINKTKTTAIAEASKEAGTSKGVKRPRDEEGDKVENELAMTQPGKRMRKKRVYRECVPAPPDSNDSDTNDSMSCTHCKRSFHNKSTLNNHERFCDSEFDF